MKKLIFFSLFIIFSTSTFSQELWVSTSYNNVPSPRGYHTAVWTGDKMIVWGGQYNFEDIRTGGIYDLLLNSWSSVDTLNAPLPRELHTAIWTGSKMIIWGGLLADSTGSYLLNSGGIYDPLTNTWDSINTVNAPSGRFHHTAIWTGTHMIIWGGQSDPFGSTNTGGIYDPITNTWAITSINNAPSPRHYHTAVWTGSKMIVWGGSNDADTLFNTGGIFDPISNSWQTTSVINAPTKRFEHTSVWTGNKMIIWGATIDKSGGIYDPFSDNWTSTAIENAPVGRVTHSAIWTGNKMIIWGGLGGSANILNSGGIYDPINDNWVSISMSNAPLPRFLFTGIWTGNKMIVWGGAGNNGPMNSGGVYSNPTVIGIGSNDPTLPKRFNLYQNYPNPFNPITSIKYDLPKEVNVTIKVYNLLGREVVVLMINVLKKAGRYEINWNASNYSSGIYFCKIEAGDFVDSKKMVLIK